MSRAQWVGVVAAIATLATSGAAQAAPARGPAATVNAYLAALRARQPARVCALLDPRLIESARACRSWVRLDLQVDRLARVRLEGVFVHGARARAVVDLVTVPRRPRVADATRARMLLRRKGDRWLVTSSGTLPGTSAYAPAAPGADPRPAGRARALRRLADDELLALSGNGTMLCSLLAPGAPLSGEDGEGGACRTATLVGTDPGSGRSLRLARYAAHPLDARHARLDVVVAAVHAVPSRGRPGYALTIKRWTDTLYAVRVGRRWQLVKPSRVFYLVTGQPLPADVASPAATATWPVDDAGQPSLSDTLVTPACRVPPALWGRHDCGRVDSLAAAPGPAGGGRVAWTTAFSTRTRAVAGGVAAAPAVAAPAIAHDDRLWHVADHGLIPVAGGTLLVEVNEDRLGVRVTPLDAAGAARGPARTLDPGVENPDDGTDPVVAAGPPEAGTAIVALDDGRLKRLNADGGSAGPDLAARSLGEYDTGLAVLPDATLLAIGVSDDGVRARRLGADGRATGPAVVQPLSPGATYATGAPSVAVDAQGRALIVWHEAVGAGRVVVRSWTYDPAAPLASVPVTIARLSFPRTAGADEYSDPHPAEIQVGATPGGGWGVAYVEGGAIWALRLDAAGGVATAPRRVTDLLAGSDYGASSVVLAGDTLAWVSRPRIAGVFQVRSAPLP